VATGIKRLGRPSRLRVAAFLFAAAALPSFAAEVPLPELRGTQARVQEAIRSRFQEVQSSPDAADAWGVYGMTLDAHRFVEEAVAAYREAYALDSSDFRWPYYLAILIDARDPLEGRVWFERALAIDGSYAPARVLYAESLERIGETDLAWESFVRAVGLDPKNALALFGLGRIALRRGEVDRALELLRRADDLAPPTQAIVASLARAHRKAGQSELARRRAQEARSLPRMVHHRDERRAAVQALAVDSESYLRRSRTYSEVGRLDRALRELEVILELEPEMAEARLAAASIYDQMGRPSLALSELERAIRLGGDLAEARPLHASLLFKLERFQEAEQQARIFLRDKPNDIHMLLLVSMVAAQRGDVESMIDAVDRAYAHRSEDRELNRLMVQLLDDLGTSFAATGRFDVAIQRMEQALEILDGQGEPGSVVESYRQRLELYRSGRSR